MINEKANIIVNNCNLSTAYDDSDLVVYDEDDLENKDIDLPYLYAPRDYQADEWDEFFKMEKRRFIRVWHRRAGKDKDFWNIFIASTQMKVGQYYYMLPTIAQARKVIYEGIDNDGMRFIDHIPPEMILHADKGEMKWELINGSIIRLAGSDNFDSLVGTNMCGIVFSEWSLCNPLAWDYFEPMLRMNGGYAAFVYTARGRNHGYSLLEGARRVPGRWHVSVKTIEDTGLMTRAEYEEMLLEGKDEDIAEQEYYCSFDAAVKGAYFSKQMKNVLALGRYFNFEIETSIPCYTYWDIGLNDMMSITILQPIGKEGRIVQYYEANNEDIKHYIDWLYRWRDMHNVTFAEHWAPHDIEVRTFTGKGTLKTRKQIAKEAGIKFYTRERVASKEEGISYVRQVIPKLFFRKTYGEKMPALDPRLAPIYSKADPSGCEHLVNCLSNYHQKYDEKKQTYLDRPDHDWSSHAVDSIQNLGAWWKERAETLKDKRALPQARKNKHNLGF